MLAPIGEELVINLARADDHALHFLWIELVDVTDHRLEATVRKFLERRHRLLVAEQALRTHHDQRLAIVAHHLPAQQVIDLRRRRRHAHLHVVLRAQLQIAFGTRRRMLGPLPFEPVRQQQRETAHAAPFHFTRADELVDDDLRAVGEVAELRFPDHQLIRLRRRITVLEPQHRVLGQHAVDDLEVRLIVLQMLQRNPRSRIPFLAILVMQHRMAMRERPARDILAGHAHAVTLIEQRRIRERLAHTPIERLLAFGHRTPLRHHPLDA